MRNFMSSNRIQTPHDKIKIIPLGGVEEIGINCTVYESYNDIVIVDMGLGFPENSYYGIDYIVPDVSYLQKKLHKIKALCVTHGHLDHIGGIPYLLPLIGFPPIVASPFTIELIKSKLEEKKLLNNKIKFIPVDEKSVTKLGGFTLQYFRVTHSIPQCLGFHIQHGDTKIVHTGDFKFDNSPVNEPVSDYAKLAQFGSQGVDLMLSDSTNSLKKGYPISESDVAESLREIVEYANGRVIVAAFSGLIGRLYQLIDIANKNNRKVAIAGYSMNQSIRIAQEIGYIKVPKDLIINVYDVNKYRPEQIMILTTGAQGESDAALFKMASADYKGIKIQKSDTVIISAGTIAGNQRAVQLLNDELAKKGAIVMQSDNMDLFTSGHGYQEDQKIMLNLVKPKYFIPVHGYQYFLRAHAQTAKTVGVKEENIIMARRGLIIEGNSKLGFKPVKEFKCEPLLVSGSGVGDVGSAVLKEREQLGNYGLVIVTVKIKKDTSEVQKPFILTRGFVYVRDSQELLEQISQNVAKILEESKDKLTDSNFLRETIIEELSSYLYKETEREPMIMPIINYI